MPFSYWTGWKPTYSQPPQALSTWLNIFYQSYLYFCYPADYGYPEDRWDYHKDQDLQTKQVLGSGNSVEAVAVQ